MSKSVKLVTVSINLRTNGPWAIATMPPRPQSPRLPPLRRSPTWHGQPRRRTSSRCCYRSRASTLVELWVDRVLTGLKKHTFCAATHCNTHCNTLRLTQEGYAFALLLHCCVCDMVNTAARQHNRFVVQQEWSLIPAYIHSCGISTPPNLAMVDIYQHSPV